MRLNICLQAKRHPFWTTACSDQGWKWEKICSRLGVVFGRWGGRFCTDQRKINCRKICRNFAKRVTSIGSRKISGTHSKIRSRFVSHSFSRVVKAWFRQHSEIELLPWPPKGADMNPIENVWVTLLRILNSFVQSADEVWQKAREKWDRYRGKQTYWRKLALSMRSRLQLIILFYIADAFISNGSHPSGRGEKCLRWERMGKQIGHNHASKMPQQKTKSRQKTYRVHLC